MNQHIDRMPSSKKQRKEYKKKVAQRKEQEQEQKDKKQEEDKDISFATSSLPTCLGDIRKYLNKQTLSLNEIKTSKKEPTVNELSSRRDPKFDQDIPTSLSSSSND